MRKNMIILYIKWNKTKENKAKQNTQCQSVLLKPRQGVGNSYLSDQILFPIVKLTYKNEKRQERVDIWLNFPAKF